MSTTSGGARATVASAPSQYAQFQYGGATVLTVRGPSGRVYRFAPGATAIVDPRDTASLAGVRQLRRLR